ncbi:arginine N-succinyltransferase [Sphingomonas alpina]|uniref:Arginine N-succinyltransferase n=1 Tax=Sphingomonas alpina TaxID=653931 RepID=A0A7H0LMB2_9SPHN|nr:arginine N-succinyltransferase [Sphingomonas alpina]QNQ10815.1 arginine N-succinyltransferase [Sphingomonas alpina]
MTDSEIVIRAAGPADIDAFMRLATTVGKGMTNLPADKAVLLAKLDASVARLADGHDGVDPTPIWLALEIDGTVMGAAALFPSIGNDWPFYSYKRSNLRNRSLALEKTVTVETLTLNNDLGGMAEVGGLVVMPQARGSGAGRLAAQSRYLFMAEHRDWFPRSVMAEMRGYIDPQGRSPVWEALGRPFYQMDFEEADHFSGVAGNQFIAELGPRHCLYVSMLPEDARAALGRPHDASRIAYDMLLKEGFRDTGYCDIFDGGPQVFSEIDELRILRGGRQSIVGALGIDGDPVDSLCSAGRGAAFRAVRAPVIPGDGRLTLSERDAIALRVGAGDSVRHVALSD